MRIWELDDEARETWLVANSMEITAGTPVSLATCGELGAPNPPAGQTWTKLLKHAPITTTAKYIKTYPMRTYELTLDMWIYLEAFDWSDEGNDALLDILELQSMDGAVATSRLKLIVNRSSGDRTLGYFAAKSYSDAAALVTTAYTNHRITTATPGWYNVIVKWTAESAVGAGDGTMSIEVIVPGDATEYLKEYTAQSHGALPVNRMLQNVNLSAGSYKADDFPTYYFADMVLTDSEGADAPGVLLPWLYEPTDTTIKLKLVCDRPCSGVVTYGATGTEHTATDISSDLADDDDGRILEFLLTGLSRGSTYTWQVVLTGDDTTTATVTTCDADDSDNFTFTHMPAAGTRCCGRTCNDTHVYVVRPGDSIDAAARTTARGLRPSLILYLGDILAPTGTSLTCGRAAIRQKHYPSFDRLRRNSGGTTALWCQGNHDAYDINSTTAPAYVKAVAPQTTFPSLQSLQWGDAEFWSLGDGGDWTAATSLAMITGELTNKVTASTAKHKIICSHGHVADMPVEGGKQPDMTMGLIADGATDPGAALVTLMEARAAAGDRIVHLHAHTHGLTWWVNNGVIYITSPPFQARTPKDTTWGDYTLAAGDGDSVNLSMEGYGSDGAAGWVQLLISPNWFRARIFDSYVDSGVYLPRKRFEQWRMVR